MALDPVALQNRLEHLRKLGESLAALLATEADRVDATGTPPGQILLDDLERYRDQVRDLSSSIHGHTDIDQQQSFESLEMALKQQILEQSLGRQLETVLAVQHEDPDFGSIRLLHEDVRALQAKLVAQRAPEKDVAALQDGTHPWLALVRLVRDREQLDDVEWSQLNDTVTDALGRSLATAVARGKLRLATEMLPATSDTLPQVSPLEATPQATPVTPTVAHVVLPIEVATSVVPVTLEPPPLPTQVVSNSILFEDEFVAPKESLDSLLKSSRHAAAETVAAQIKPPPAPQAAPKPLTPQTPAATATPIPAADASAASDHLWDDFPAPRAHIALANAGKILQEDFPPAKEPKSPAKPPSKADARQNKVVKKASSLPAPAAALPTETAATLPKVQPPAASRPVASPVTSDSLFDDVGHQPAKPTRSLEAAQSIFDDDGLDSSLDSLPASVRMLSDGRTGKSSLGKVDAISAASMRFATSILVAPKFTEPTGTLGELATCAYTGDEAERRSLVPDLILQLIFEGRPGLAFHLASCLERIGRSGKRFVPSWIIRAWTLGHAILFPKGQLAGQIQDDFERYNPGWLKEQPEDWGTVLRFLLRAAALRPAIIAPSTRAAGIVRSFSLEDDCIHLYNYCARIGATGEKLGGIYPGIFKRAQDSTPLAENLLLLQSDVRNWQSEISKGAIRYEPATQLFLKTHWSVRANNAHRFPEAARAWQKWQQLLRMVDGVVSPVLKDQRSELQRVRVEIDRLAQQTWIDEERSTRSPASPIVLPVEDMRAFLRQAIGFGERWVALHGSASIHRNNYVPPEAEELRQDIESRHLLVTTELHDFLGRHNTFEYQKAVACLLLSIQEVRELVNPQVPAESQEPDQRHLLNAELLKISDLRLNSGWEPAAEPQTVEDEILKFLASPQPDWATAFQMHLTQGHHGSAQRILALRHWTADERSSLQAVLEEDRERVRNDFRSDLEEVQGMVAEALHQEVVSELDRGGFEARIERLRRVLQSEDDLSSAVLELNRLRENVERRRGRDGQRIAPTEATRRRPSGWVMDFSGE